MATSRRIPTPVVLVLASAMVSIGVAAFWISTSDDTAGAEGNQELPSRVRVDTQTPEGAAESFLDAWRKREHDVAHALSTGTARAEVEERRRADEALSEEERAIKSQVWDTMAGSRLGLQIEESETPSDERVILRGTAEGDFLGQPYIREIAFVMVAVEGEWKVAQMALGEILSETPDVLALPADRHGATDPLVEPAPEEPAESGEPTEGAP